MGIKTKNVGIIARANADRLLAGFRNAIVKEPNGMREILNDLSALCEGEPDLELIRRQPDEVLDRIIWFAWLGLICAAETAVDAYSESVYDLPEEI